MNRFYTVSRISENLEYTPEGYLVCFSVPIARTGSQEYLAKELSFEDVDGLIEVVRTEAEVFRSQTVSSFEGKPFVISHPDTMITAENWKQHACGLVQNVRRGKGDSADLLLADILVTDSEAIQLVMSGLREISCGYDAEYELLSCKKALQKNIIGNHIALVNSGRCGKRCKINDNGMEGSHMAKKPGLREKFINIFAKTMDEFEKEDETEPSGMKEILAALTARVERLEAILAAKDTSEKEEGEGKKSTADCGCSRAGRELYSQLSLFIPGLDRKTVSDSAEVRRMALRTAVADKRISPAVKNVLGKFTVDTADVPTVRAALALACELKKAINNESSKLPSQVGFKADEVSAAAINKRNRELYNQ